ncbi:hypothetical protein BK022_11735 [Methylorubrum extorquens]|uniref:histidine kinase n=1 Tax=Methylorubrum extorquens TaxID=408 RepID=A0A1S1P630_METEX|nr:hypothetical protein BK022_11735 [Methylorubrum extorquens]
MIGSVAHDLNNVLQIISGNLALLSRKLEGNDAALRHVSRAMAGVDLGTRLAERVLRRSSTQAQVPASTDLAAAFLAMRPLIADTVGPSVDVTFQGSVSNVIASFDPAEFQNVVLNLAINARDAMKGRGSLVVAIDEDATDQFGEIIVSVSDTGCGMPPELIKRIFEPYFTTKGSGGTGLGLAAVKRFADDAGGRVAVQSRIGLGTTISLHLPISTPADPACQHMNGSDAFEHERARWLYP